MAENNSGFEVRSTISADGTFELSLERHEVRVPLPGEVTVRVEAAPINPADLLVMFGPVDTTSLEAIGSTDRPVVRGVVPPHRLASVNNRLGQCLAIGNEGAGTIIAAGSGTTHLLGRVVALRDGMFSQFRTVSASDCLVLPEGSSARDGASAMINPMTALAMVETMRREGHTALVNTAAASTLGQMLNRLCQVEDVPLVNIVRSEQQAILLRSVGARYVVDSSNPDFQTQLLDAIDQTGATLAYDAIGGGTMASDILYAMNQSQTRKSAGFSRYGSPVHRQVYIYGLLNTEDRILRQNIGTAWSVGGWLMSWQLKKFGKETEALFHRRMVSELKTTFRTEYGEEIGLSDLFRPEVIELYRKPASGRKFLVVPKAD